MNPDHLCVKVRSSLDESYHGIHKRSYSEYTNPLDALKRFVGLGKTSSYPSLIDRKPAMCIIGARNEEHQVFEISSTFTSGRVSTSQLVLSLAFSYEIHSLEAIPSLLAAWFIMLIEGRIGTQE